MTTQTIPELWIDRQRLRAENERCLRQEETAMDAVPDWARETHRTIARHHFVLLTKNLPESNHEEARRAIAELETVDYLAALEPYAAWDRRSSAVYGELTKVEDAICETPAATIDDVLTKLRVAGFLIDLDYMSSDGVLDEESMTPEERLTLSAYRDLERLTAATTS